MSFIVAIDGPAGTGKGTVAKIIAQELNLIYIDTGAMYRCVALEGVKNNILPNEKEKIEKILQNIHIELKNIDGIQRIYLNGKDVSTEIRTPIISENASKFAVLKNVRDKMTVLQQKMGENSNIIMEGRDIGTVVFPNADVKIYLDCSCEERAKRRYKQNLEQGLNQSYEEVLNAIIARDKKDSERELAPLTKAKDAVIVDSTNKTIEEVVKEIEEIIKCMQGVN